MCGRLNITDDPLTRLVSQLLGIHFVPHLGEDLKPSETVSTIIFQKGGYQQWDVPWGIKPSWAKRLIINAQVESVANKATFKHGFAHQRVVVPCSGWYEWRKQAGSGSKEKFLFRNPDSSPLYIAGVIVNSNNLVTLTTKPNSQCAQYHHRMPFLVPEIGIYQWLTAAEEEARNYLLIPHQPLISIEFQG